MEVVWRMGGLCILESSNAASAGSPVIKMLVSRETGKGKYLKYSSPPLLALQKQEKIKQGNLLNKTVKTALLLLRPPPASSSLMVLPS